MKSRALDVLRRLLGVKEGRRNRLTDLLKDPQENHPEGWHMCVPPCFNEALDIRRTERVANKKKTLVWTQGSAFSFRVGDTLYDTVEAYRVWSEALKHINLCVSVKQASDAAPAGGSGERNPGRVTFSVLSPDSKRSKVVRRGEHTLTQDEFVKFLIQGPPEELRAKLAE